jgi:hypothetical protein
VRGTRRLAARRHRPVSVIETPEKLHGSDDLDTSLSQPLGQLLALEEIPIAGHDHRRVPRKGSRDYRRIRRITSPTWSRIRSAPSCGACSAGSGRDPSVPSWTAHQCYR